MLYPCFFVCYHEIKCIDQAIHTIIYVFRPKEVDNFCFCPQEGQHIWLLGTNFKKVVHIMQKNFYIVYFKIKLNFSSLAFSCMVKSQNLPSQILVDLHYLWYGLFCKALKGTLSEKKDTMICYNNINLNLPYQLLR